jgi:hypothetical protein
MFRVEAGGVITGACVSTILILAVLGVAALVQTSEAVKVTVTSLPQLMEIPV